MKEKNQYMSSIKKIIKNDYVFTFINKISNIIFGVITSIFITRYSGASLKGEYAIITNTLTIYALFANLGIYQAYPKYKRDKCPLVLMKFINIFYAQFFLLLLIAGIFSIFNFQSMIFLLLPLVVLSNQLNFIAMVEDVFFKNKMNMISNFIKLLYSIIVFFFCEKNILYLVGSLVIVDIFLDFVYIYKFHIPINFKCLKISFVYEIVKYSFIPMLSSLLMTLNYKFDIIMLDLLKVNTFNIGQYSLAVNLAGYGWLVPDIFKEVLFSKTAIYDASDEINKCLKVGNFACFLMITGVALFGYWAIILMYGKEFIISYPVTLVLFIGIPAMTWFKIISTLYLAQGKRYFYFFVLLISVVVNVLFNYVLIPILGIFGAAIASVFSYSACGGLFLYDYCKNNNIRLSYLFTYDKNTFTEILSIFRSK